MGDFVLLALGALAYVCTGLMVLGAMNLGPKDEFGDTDPFGFACAVILWPIIPLIALLVVAGYVAFVLPWRAGRWIGLKAKPAALSPETDRE